MQEKKDKKINSKEIFGNTSIIIIIHCGYEYQLRITKENKLILTK
jgi:hemin uptake protein HemP